MITIKVKKRNDEIVEIESKGHAGYAVRGKDIVCSAVSILFINTVNSLEKFTKDKVNIKSDDGYLKITVKSSSKEGQLLLNSLVLGLTELEKENRSKNLIIHFI